ncbi:MAG: conserved rane protein of unknown function [Myxococcales bacterium]|nr:conserved rane protein of unknown function [Myxococcales bacterium]
MGCLAVDLHVGWDLMTSQTLIVLAITSLGAATVNGALGYGYSSISVPIALLVVAGRILNPALVIVEVIINLYALWWNRHAARRVLPRVMPLAIGLIPGVIAGALLLGKIAPSHVKLAVFSVLLPLILVQASGLRWPIRNERRASVPLGAGIGVLYGLTTISGPPLALFWNNQGLAKDDFKVSLAVIRSIESVCALGAYAFLGLLTRDSASLLPWIAPGVLFGFPIGHRLIQKVSVETFRRVCMSFDAYLVSFGLARTLGDTGLAPIIAYQLMPITAIIDIRLLWRYFRPRTKLAIGVASREPA